MTIIAITLFAFLNEGTVEYLFGKVKWMKPLIGYVALATGIAFAFAYQANIFAALDLPIQSAYPFVDYIVTGIIIGRGSSYLNTIVEFIKNLGRAKAVEAKVEAARVGVIGAGDVETTKLKTLAA